MAQSDHHRSAQSMVHRHRTVQDGTARATVFGVSDGLVSNVALIIGVAAAASSGRSEVLLAGVSGLLAGAASMAAGEYVSVKAQTELVERELEVERRSIAEQPGVEAAELAGIYEDRGVDAETARKFAEAVMKNPDVALEVHAREELGVDPNEVGNPVMAAVSSFAAFALGALLPLIPWFFSRGTTATIASVTIAIIAAAAVGVILATFTERSKLRTAFRQVGWAVAACLLTFAIGSAFGSSGI